MSAWIQALQASSQPSLAWFNAPATSARCTNLNPLASGICQDPLGFGVRAGAIFGVIVGSFALGRWVQRMVGRLPVRPRFVPVVGKLAAGESMEDRTDFSRWLGRVALFCVLLAGAAIIVAIANYGASGTPIITAEKARTVFWSIAPQIIAVLLLAALTLAVGRLLQRATVIALDRTGLDLSLQLLGGRIMYVVVVIVGVVVILSVWGVALAVPVAVLSVTTLALTLALQDVLRNLFAGVYLLVERPFVIGDEITVNTFTGRIEDIELRITTLRTSDGQQVIVPNATVFTTVVVNTTPHARLERAARRHRLLGNGLALPAAAEYRRRVVLTVTLPSEGVGTFNQIEQRITSAVAKARNVREEPAPSVMLNHVGQGKLDLRVAFWVPAQEDVGQEAILEAVNQICNTEEDADVSVTEPAAPTA